MTVTVRDDGPGIPAGRLEQAAAQGRLGVAQSIRGRVTDLGGQVTIITGPGEGTGHALAVGRSGERGTCGGGFDRNDHPAASDDGRIDTGELTGQSYGRRLINGDQLQPQPVDVASGSSAGVPSPTTRPRWRTTTRSTARSASTTLCVTRSTAEVPAASPRSLIPQQAPANGVDIVRGFVKHDHLARLGRGHAERGQAAHTTGQLLATGVGPLSQIETSDQLVRPLPRPVARGSPQPGHDLDGLTRRDPVERSLGLWLKRTHPTRHRRIRDRVLAVDVNGSGGWLGETGHLIEQCRLASAVMSEQADHLARIDLEGDIVVGANAPPVVLGEAVEREHSPSPLPNAIGQRVLDGAARTKHAHDLDGRDRRPGELG